MSDDRPRVEHLFIKPHSGSPLEPRSSLNLCRGVGIEGDRNAQVGSPRQVLVVGRPVLDAFRLNPGDLQENIVLSDRVEQFVSGQVLHIGPDVQIRLTYWCEPCVQLEQIRPGLARSLRGQRGILGIVTRGGHIAIGDGVHVGSVQFPPLPDANRDRFNVFVARVPAGSVVRTSDLLLALGWTPSFYRTIPTFIKKAPLALPVHRIVAIDGTLLEKHIPDQHHMLLAEGIEVHNGRVNPAYVWPAECFHELGE
jgi:alkylated DNA nucleotide flippase Atl1